MEQILIITLSSSIFISLILISWLFKENRRLFKENDSLKKSSDKVRKYTNDLLSIKIGDRAIIPNYGLVYDKKHSFHVNYEVEIIEISVKNLCFLCWLLCCETAKKKSGVTVGLNAVH